MKLKIIALWGVGALCLFEAVGASAKSIEVAHPSSFPIEITEAKQPYLPEVVGIRAGYFSVKNISDQAVIIVGVQSEAFGTVHMHRTVRRNEGMAMELVPELIIEPRSVTEFRPEGLHLMMHKSKYPLPIGHKFTVVLKLDSGLSVNFEMPVVSAYCENCDSSNAEPDEHAHHHH